MCGLAGWVDYTRKLDDEFPAIFAMTDTLALRGPDAEGIWKHRNALLGHRRLAVIDLSGGVQPMSYRFPTGQEVTLVYTGEVYNHDALRERLRRAGHEFRTRSDTEVVLHAYLQWGERCCEYLTGMFAFAVFDGRDGHLLLVRDRLGIKPLYYARHREGLLFGSEIKSILAHPEFAARLDAVGLVDLLTLSRGTSQTPFREVQELLPGHLLSWRPNSQAKLRRYWEVRRQEHADHFIAVEDGEVAYLECVEDFGGLPGGGFHVDGMAVGHHKLYARRRHGNSIFLALDFFHILRHWRWVIVLELPISNPQSPISSIPAKTARRRRQTALEASLSVMLGDQP